MLRRAIAVALVLVVCVTTALWAYHRYLRPFRIAVVQFSDTDWVGWESAGLQTSFSMHRFELEELEAISLANYNLIVVRAMGLNLTDEQIRRFAEARSLGTHFLMIVPTTDRAREQNSLPKEHQQVVDEYLKQGGEENLAGMLCYLAREIGGKEVTVPEPIEKPQNGFFHLGDAVFETLEQYEGFLDRDRPELSDDAPRVALIGAFLDPRDTHNRAHVDYILQSLEAQGTRVYPMFGQRTVLKQLEAVAPDLAIVFPHGRLAMGQSVIEVLQRMDCPCVSALALLSNEADWMADERGMAGNFLSQSITTPELDGVIEPIAITALEPNERGIDVRTPIAERIDKRVRLALNWLKLRRKPNAEKRVVIVYYKGPGLAALTAGGLEVVPSLYNTLKRLQAEGYDLGDQMPASPEELQQLIQTRGKTLGQWAIGSYEQFLAEADPEFVPADQYAQWFRAALSEKRQRETLELWGPIPGKQMVAQRDDKPCLVISRIRLGNIVIMPQPTVGGGDEQDEVAAIHGTDQAVPHFYLGAYLWARHGFQADAIVHFGTHGSLEFTYGKSVCLSRDCWPDILMGDVPHIYPYVINNVGEAMIAKRRSNAVIISHLTPPFVASSLYGELSTLHDKVHQWETTEEGLLREELRRTITELVRSLNLAADLGFDATQLHARLVVEEEIQLLHNHLHQLKDQSVTDGLHVIGRGLSDEQIRGTVTQMLVDRAASTLAEALQATGEADVRENQGDLVRGLVGAILDGTLSEESFFDAPHLAELRAEEGGHEDRPTDTGTGSSQQAESTLPTAEPSAHTVGSPAWWQETGVGAVRRLDNVELQRQFLTLLSDIGDFAEALRDSPRLELDRFVQALRGGYIPPSSGGDPLFNPAAVPTGRNLYGVDAEQAPSEEAWRVGCRLADEILAQHREQYGHYPRRVAFSLWGGEFIRGQGTTMAQILYLIGARPVRNSRGAVHDVELIPSEELGRPRIDVLIQTSGQFRDIAASRIALMDKAVQLASELGDEPHPNFVRDGTSEAEMQLKALGHAPREARQFATARIFGAPGNRSYGTGIMGLVEKGDTWEDAQEVADRYVRNMGGIYRDEQNWGTYLEGLFEAQLQGTEVVVQPRSSNTWGPLSLDHVYEFMGGLTLAVRAKTGVDPTGYFNDLRKPGQAQTRTAVAAIREEARTTLWNPRFLQGMQREGASAAAALTESVRNMYGWNVMQPAAIGQDMWDETYAVLLQDKHNLEIREFFEQKNPYALQNMTAIMLETARKGYWKPSEETLRNLAQIHVEVVEQYGAGCSYETCGNQALHTFIEGQLITPGSDIPSPALAAYQATLAGVLQSSVPLPDVEGIAMDEKIERTDDAATPAHSHATLVLAAALLLGTVSLLVTGYRLPKQ